MMVLGYLIIYGVFYDFYSFPKVFIYIHEYSNQIICISDQKKKGMRLRFNLVPSLVLYDK